MSNLYQLAQLTTLQEGGLLRAFNTLLLKLAFSWLRAIWKSQMDRTLVVEKGKPAWNHFVEGFVNTCTLLEHTEMAGFEQWPVMQSRLKAYMMKREKYIN